MRPLRCLLLLLLLFPALAHPARTIIFDRPLTFPDAEQTPIDPAEPLEYYVYIGPDTQSLVRVRTVPPVDDLRMTVSLTDDELTFGQALCVSSVRTVGTPPDTITIESQKRCGPFTPTNPISVLYLLAD